MRIETKYEIGEFFKKLQEYLKKHKIFKNHHINIADFDDSNPRVWGMAISIFPVGTKDELFQQQNGDNLFIYNIQFWKEWHKTKRVIIFAFWAGENAEKAEEFKRLKKECPNKSNETKSGFSYNVDNDGNYLDLSKRNIPNELKEIPNEIDENVIFPIIEKTLEKLYADYNDKFFELFNLKQTDRYQQIINEYIEYCKSDEIWDEGYKWKAISYFKENWNFEADDFGVMFKQSVDKRANLIHQYPIATLIDSANLFPDRTKKIFKYIFDDQLDLNKRYEYFYNQFKEIVENIKEQLNKAVSQPREAEFAFLLTCNNPDKNYFYNSRFYEKFAKYIGQEPKKAGEKYGHYLELMNYFRDNYVIKNSEVIEITKQKLPENEQNKENISLITQSIIYLVFEVIRNNADEKNLISALEEIEYENANNLYNLIDKLVSGLKIENADKRMHYNCTPKDNFNITVGQRYAIRLDTKNFNWDIIIPKEINITESKIGYKFDGKPETFSYRTNDFSELKFYAKEFIEASLGELNRTTKSGYRKSTNLAFEKSIFDIGYRNEIFNQVFEQDFRTMAKFDYNYWIFQGNPKYYNIEEALKSNSIKSWTVKSHKNSIKVGDKVILWVTGEKSGCYALCSVNSEVRLRKDDISELKFYNEKYENIETERVEISVDYNFVNSPLFSSRLLNLPEFKSFKGGNQGTNFTATKEQYDIILNLSQKKNKVNMPINQILFGPPGTGKTYHTINKAVEIVDNNFYRRNINNRTELKRRFKELKDSNQIVFTTFHQSMSYEEFLESLKPKIDKKTKEVYYDYEKGIFKLICESAEEKPSENFVLIIDEINRGNIASIFGELITLIEPDKRKGEDEELSVKLPYSKQDFTVPKNLYIIGTMNTADRSVEALDSALRRRFVFNEMPPDEKLLDKDFFGINLPEVLSKINIRIEKLIDKDHKIGHSYFMNLKNKIDLQNAFKNKIIPLLEEYFYGDLAKIGLVLGVDFVLKSDFEENIFKSIDDIENYTDFENRVIYKTIVPEKIDEFINAVKNIYL